MINDQQLDNLFAHYQSPAQDDIDVLPAIQRSMDAVDLARQFHAQEIRRQRRRARWALLVGLVFGTLLTIIAVALPTPAQLFATQVHSGLLRFLLLYGHYPLIALIVLALGYGVATTLQLRKVAEMG